MVPDTIRRHYAGPPNPRTFDFYVHRALGGGHVLNINSLLTNKKIALIRYQKDISPPPNTLQDISRNTEEGLKLIYADGPTLGWMFLEDQRSRIRTSFYGVFTALCALNWLYR